MKGGRLGGERGGSVGFGGTWCEVLVVHVIVDRKMDFGIITGLSLVDRLNAVWVEWVFSFEIFDFHRAKRRMC
jgi:hypothetical protein